MSDFFSKIKDKLFPKPELDFEDDQDSGEGSEIIDDVEVDASDPSSVSDAKKKNIVIVIVALALSVLVYFILFSEEEVKEDLVKPIEFGGGVATSQESPFEINIQENKSDDDIAVLDKPAVPELPEMPEIEENKKEKEKLFDEDIFEEDKVAQEKNELSKDPKVAKLSDPEETKERDSESSIGLAEPVSSKDKESNKKFKDPRYAPIIVLKGTEGKNFPGAGQDDNLKILDEESVVDVEDSKINIKPSFIKNRENVIGQGKIINAVLETAIDTEIEGSVRAIVSRDVYGEVGDRVLISKGSRLYGSYSTKTARGNSRINISWTRMIRPDGVSVAINSIASDQFGRAGIKGTLDNKFGETVANTILSSALAIAGVAATDALTNSQTSTTTTDPTTGTSTITQSAINQAVSDIARNITNSATTAVSGYFDTAPRITVPQGTRITILVNSDIKVPTFNSR